MNTKIIISTGAENIIKAIIRQQIVKRKFPIHKVRNCGFKRAKEIFEWADIEWPKHISSPSIYHDNARSDNWSLIR